MKQKLSPDKSSLTVHVPMKLQRRGGRKLIIAPDGGELKYTPPAQDSALIKGIDRAPGARKAIWLQAQYLLRVDDMQKNSSGNGRHRHKCWRRLLEEGEVLSIAELAKAEKINDSYLSRVLRLTLLAPDIIEAILDGRHPKGVKLTDLLKPFPMEWHRQREKFGFKATNRGAS
jgi:hypothetical protein